MTKHEYAEQRLLPIEERFAKFNSLNPVTTLTWFAGDHQLAAAFLGERMEGILSANPWLAGKLQSKSSTKVLRYPLKPSPLDISSILGHMTDPQKAGLTRDAPFENVADECKPFLVQGNNVWKVTIVPSCEAPTERFALVNSMSHAVGDGHTYYSIHNMLCGSSEIESLDTERMFDTTKLQKEALGEEEHGVFLSAGYAVGMVLGFFENHDSFSYRVGSQNETTGSPAGRRLGSLRKGQGSNGSRGRALCVDQ